jgi:predicted nucleic acid-binding protein
VARPGSRSVGNTRAPAPPFADGQIAGIAGAEGLTVVTGNTADFEPFARLEEGIRVENWFES